MTPRTTPFRILFVCTGNICRSPQAERLVRAEFRRRGFDSVIQASSAGVAALVGEPMDPAAAAQTIGLGGDPSGHLARQLDAAMVEDADLVLTMERAHRARVVRLVARANRYAFTLPEFARLGGALLSAGDAAPPDPATPLADRLRALVPQIAAERGMTPPVADELDEIEDPFRRPDAVYVRSARRVASAVFDTCGSLLTLAEGDGDG